MKLNTGVYSSTGFSSLSSQIFYALMGTFIIYGLGLTYWIAAANPVLHMSLPLIIVTVVIALAGAIVSSVSTNPLVTFIGYNMIIIPFGLIMGPWLNYKAPGVFENACLIALIITVIMTFAATVAPQLFANLGVPLFFALCCLVVVRIVQAFVPSLQHLRIIDYISAGIFSLYIGFDMYRASTIARTLDNSIKCGVDLYLDLVNLITSIAGSDNDD